MGFGFGDPEKLKDLPWTVDMESEASLSMVSNGNHVQSIIGYALVKTDGHNFLSDDNIEASKVVNYTMKGTPAAALDRNLDEAGIPQGETHYLLESVKFWSKLKNQDAADIFSKIEQIEKEGKSTIVQCVDEGRPQSLLGEIWADTLDMVGLGNMPVMIKMDLRNNQVTQYRL